MFSAFKFSGSYLACIYFRDYMFKVIFELWWKSFLIILHFLLQDIFAMLLLFSIFSLPEYFIHFSSASFLFIFVVSVFPKANCALQGNGRKSTSVVSWIFTELKFRSLVIKCLSVEASPRILSLLWVSIYFPKFTVCPRFQAAMWSLYQFVYQIVN